MVAKVNLAEPAMRIPLLFLGFFLALVAPLKAEELTSRQIGDLTRTVLFGSEEQMEDALQTLEARGNKDIIPSLIVTARYRGDQRIFQTLTKLTGQEMNNWNDAMLWQEIHPQIKPNPSFQAFKLDVFNRIDPNFTRFLGKGRADPKNLKIRLEEIVWGGVQVDGIPSLDNPQLIKAERADYLKDSDPVFGVSINGDVRAYPLRIMGWHEMFNETIGGVPVALAYCTLCSAGILFETQVEGRNKPLVFGSSGFLYRSNKLMFDRETDSLWNQFTGEPVSGPLVKSGIKLKNTPRHHHHMESLARGKPGHKSPLLGYRLQARLRVGRRLCRLFRQRRADVSRLRARREQGQAQGLCLRHPRVGCCKGVAARGL